MPGTEAMFLLVFHATWLIYERVNAMFVCNMFFSVKEHKVCEPLSIKLYYSVQDTVLDTIQLIRNRTE